MKHALPMSRWWAALMLCAIGAPAAAAQTAPSEPDALLADGRVQEAAWAARAAGDSSRADSLLARLDSILRSEPLHAAPLSMDSQGVSYTFRLTFGGGVEAIFKVDGSDIFCTECGTDREVAVYAIDRLLGLDLTPLTVLRSMVVDGDTLSGSAMYFIQGARLPADVGAGKPDRLHLFDAIIGNSDRHAGNWLVRENGAVVAIDHNRAFEYQPVTRPKTCWESEVDALRSPRSLGAAYERYRTLPRDSLAVAVAMLVDEGLRQQFVDMRDRVVDRVDQRARRPRRSLPRTDCPAR